MRNNKLQYLPVTMIIDNGNKLRFEIDQGVDAELAKSIQKSGIIQSLVVKPTKQSKFEIVCGSRRFQAALKNNIKQIPVMIIDTKDSHLVTLTENIQRKNLSITELAIAIKSLVEVSNYKYDQIARFTGINKSKISKLKKLGEQFLGDYKHVSFTKLPESTYLELVNHPDFYKKAEDENWNQQRVRKEINKFNDSKKETYNSQKQTFKTKTVNNKINNKLLPAHYRQSQLELYVPLELSDSGFTINAFYFDKSQPYDIDTIVEKLMELQNNLEFAIKIIRDHEWTPEDTLKENVEGINDVFQ